MKAMLLAAGRGERLKPLTEITPKPLLKIGNTTLIDHALFQIRTAGISDVVINVHHLKNQIMDHCGDGEKYDLQIQYSIEETLLETGGGILNALPKLGASPFLLLSADVWTDFPLKKLMEKKITGAHLIFVDNPDYHARGDFALDANGFVRDDLQNKVTYASFGLLHPDLFYEQKLGVFRLTDVLLPAIREKKITGEYFNGVWHNVGTEAELNSLRRYQESEISVSKERA